MTKQQVISFIQDIFPYAQLSTIVDILSVRDDDYIFSSQDIKEVFYGRFVDKYWDVICEELDTMKDNILIDLIDLKAEKANHQKLWSWLAENPFKDKLDWPDWSRNGGDSQTCVNFCFACEVVVYQHDLLKCDECPIQWPDGITCNLMGSLFKKWLCQTSQERSQVAKQIADLPWKFEKRLEYIFGEEDHEDKPTEIPEL